MTVTLEKKHHPNCVIFAERLGVEGAYDAAS